MYSDEQELAIKTTSHNTLVAASAGSGKTTTIVGRINYLIKQGIEPDTIYAITFTNMAAQEMLERIDYPIFIGTIHSLANKILQTNGVDTSRIIQDESFDELLEMTKRGHIEMPKITHLLVDELQDIADVEFDFIINTLHAQNLYFVGDSCQCQPAGTMIRLRDNVFKPIEDIEIGDSVVWYDNSKSYLCGPTTKAWNSKECKVLEKVVRPFVNDNLITITTEKNEQSRYTPNHRTFVKLNKTEYKHVVYLMCDSNYRFKVGKISMYGNNSNANPWRAKMINEGCSKIWLLDVFKTDKEARVLETKISYQYGIPQTCWQTDKVQWTKEDIEYIYEGLDTHTSAIKCLKEFNRNIKYPLLDKDNENTTSMHFASNAVTEIYACNIMPNIMQCIVYNPNVEKNKEYQTITSVKYDYITHPIDVYSLKIEEFETYVADNIVTHNSIYGFKGGNFHHFLNFLEEPTTTVYELTTNYRNPRKILAFANTFLKGMGDVYRVESHTCRKEDGEVYAEPYSMKRIISLIEDGGNYKDWFVLARKNSEVREVINALERAKIPCGTFKKAEKTFEELKQEMQENKVKVLTIHSAKGLEADNVIIIGAKKFNSEEKRICYVAATRARERLYWMAGNPVKKEYPRGNRAKIGMYDDDVGATITW